MAVSFPAALRTTRADTITTRAGSAAKLNIYTGAKPANADTAASGTLLATLTCGSPFAPGSSSGVLTANAITTANAGNTGTAGWFRVTDSTGATTVMDGTVTATGGGGDLQLVTVSLVATQPVQVTSFVWTEANT